MDLQKLKKASLHELHVRAAQRASAFSERRGWSTLAKLPDDSAFASLLTPAKAYAANELLESFRLRSDPTFTLTNAIGFFNQNLRSMRPS